MAAARIGLVACLTLAAASVVDLTSAAGQGQAGDTAQKGCTRGEPEPLLRSVPGKPRPVFRRTGDREAVETFRIDPETDLSIRHFGCAHFALEITFVTKTGGPKSASAWLSRAARWLRALPVVPDQRQIIQHIAQRVQEAATRGYTFGTPLRVSEASTLTVNLHRGPAGPRLVILYDVAL